MYRHLASLALPLPDVTCACWLTLDTQILNLGGKGVAVGSLPPGNPRFQAVQNVNIDNASTAYSDNTWSF